MSLKSLIDYLLIRTPDVERMGKQKSKRATPGTISGSRITFSFIGILAGIIASFYVTGLQLAKTSHPPSDVSQASQTVNRSANPSPSMVPTPQTSPAPALAPDLSMQRFLKVGLISVVICLLTYQGLYFSLRVYQNEPAWLILVVSFQYGYFWQSVVNATL
jgi:hypothetical protein